MGAIVKSGDRTKALRAITRADPRDPRRPRTGWSRPRAARATAAAIPGAELMMIEGMGHDLPRALWPRIIAAVAERAKRADSVLQAA